MFEVDTELYEAMNAVSRKHYIVTKTKEFSLEHPWRYAYAGEAAVRDFIEQTLQKGAQYNMEADREVNGLRILMYYLGSEFDTDPMYPWARFKRFPDKDVAVRDKEPESFIHLQKVYDHFLGWHEKACGPESLYLQKALKRIASMQIQNLPPFNNESKRLSLLSQIYPERYTLIPEDALSGQMQKQARLKAMGHSLDDNLGTTLFAIMMFMYGSNFDEDPLYRPLLADLPHEFMPGMQKEQTIFGRMGGFSNRAL